MTKGASVNVEELFEEARERGRGLGEWEVSLGSTSPGEPLSGEWAGESPAERLGDLFEALEALGEEPGDAFEWVCDVFEAGYLSAYEEVTA